MCDGFCGNNGELLSQIKINLERDYNLLPKHTWCCLSFITRLFICLGSDLRSHFSPLSQMEEMGQETGPIVAHVSPGADLLNSLLIYSQ